MIFKILKLTLGLIIVLFFNSCDTAKDNESPVLELLSVSPTLGSDSICGTLEPNNVIRLFSGDTLKLDMLMSDNEGLSQYKIDIHENFDCHGHKAASVNPWQVLEIIDLNGKSQNISKSIIVPDNATAGIYHFQIRLLDLSGNETGGTEAYSIILKNNLDTVKPNLTIDPTNQFPLNLNAGQNLTISGNVSDNLALDGGKLELVYFTLSGNRVLANEIRFDSTFGTNYNYQLNFTIPPTLPAGNYTFQLRLFDGVGNNVFSRDLIVNLN
jgi:hypothetical protein